MSFFIMLFTSYWIHCQWYLALCHCHKASMTEISWSALSVNAWIMENRTYDRSETCNKTWILSCMSLETQGQNLKRYYTQFVCKVESQDGMVMWFLREVLDFINTIKDVSLCLQVSLPRQVFQSSWNSMFLACHFNTSVLWKLHLISCIYLAFRILILNRSPDTNET